MGRKKKSVTPATVVASVKTARKTASATKKINDVAEEYDFSTAREITDHKKNISQVMTSFLVTNSKGEEVTFVCMKGHVPTEAKKALGW